MPRRESLLKKNAPTLKEVLKDFEKNDAERVDPLDMPPPGSPIPTLRAHMGSFLMKLKDVERIYKEGISDLVMKQDSLEYKFTQLETRLNEAEQIISLLTHTTEKDREYIESANDFLVEREVIYDEDENEEN